MVLVCMVKKKGRVVNHDTHISLIVYGLTRCPVCKLTASRHVKCDKYHSKTVRKLENQCDDFNKKLMVYQEQTYNAETKG